MDTILFITDLHAGSRLAELDGIREVAKAQGWHVEEIELQRLQQPFAKVLDYWRPVGCIVEGSSNLLPEASSLAGLPVVYLDPGEALWTDPAAFAVMNDDAALAEAAHRELAKGDCPHFAFVGWGPRVFWSRRRRTRFTDVLAATGRTCHVLEDPWTLGNKNDFLQRLNPWLAALPKPCGVFAVNDHFASAVLDACHSLDLAVPRDLTVVGVDDDPAFCDNQSPSLSSVRPDFRRGGCLSAELLAARLADPALPPRKVTYAPVGVTSRLSTRRLTLFGRPLVAALDLIRRSACDGLKAADVVAVLGVSERLAETRFKAATGHRITDEITAVRLDRVLEHLRNPNQAIEPIAHLCGWRSTVYLKRLFKRRFGMTMRAWRAQELSHP